MADYDLLVIGSGAAGATAATTAIHQGASRVAIVEQGILWGTCVNTGCIPSKFLLTLAEEYYYKNHGHAGLRVESNINLEEIIDEKDALISRLKQKKTDRMVTGLGIEIITGTAEFVAPGQLRIGSRAVTADRIIIATGSSPSVPPLTGLDSVPFMTNTEALNPERIPASIIVIGGRALGLEFVQLYTHLGTNVTLLQRSSRIIPEEEPEIAELLTGYLRNEGIDIRTGVAITGIRKTATGIEVVGTIGGIEQVFFAEHLLLAAGRSPNTRSLHLERAGVTTRPNGAVLVDAMLKTTTPGIWAAGDVTGEPMLETAARYSGEIAALNAFGEPKRSFDRSCIPRGIFTMPQVASVGMTERQARAAGLDPDTRTLRMDSMARSSMVGDTRGMVKIVAGKQDERLLGVHICSPLATEILQASVLAVSRHLPVHELADMYHLFPTTGEAVSVCARRFRMPGQP
jgi:mercuric reductase